MLKELWRPAAEYAGLYEVSDRGTVKNIASRHGTTPGRVLKRRFTRDGYCKVVLRNKGRDKAVLVHRLVYLSFHGVIEDGFEIDHLDGNKENNALENLESKTRIASCYSPGHE